MLDPNAFKVLPQLKPNVGEHLDRNRVGRQLGAVAIEGGDTQRCVATENRHRQCGIEAARLGSAQSRALFG